MQMIETKSVWELNVERGPNWLLVKACRKGGTVSPESSLGEALWNLMEVNLTYRLVLELDDGEGLTSELLQQLALLDERARARNGCVRVCGLQRSRRRQLRRSGHSGIFDLLPLYENRQDAVFAHGRSRVQESTREANWREGDPYSSRHAETPAIANAGRTGTS
jgi:hypothetical protein